MRRSKWWSPISVILLSSVGFSGSRVRADAIDDYRSLLDEYRHIGSLHFRTERGGVIGPGDAAHNGESIHAIYECWYAEPRWRVLSYFVDKLRRSGIDGDSRFDGVTTGTMDRRVGMLYITHDPRKVQVGVPLYDPLLTPLCPLAPPRPQNQKGASIMWSDLKTPGLLDAQLDRLKRITGPPGESQGLTLSNIFFYSTPGVFRILFDDNSHLPTIITVVADNGTELLHVSLSYQTFTHNGHIVHLPTHSQITHRSSNGTVEFEEERKTSVVDLDVPVDSEQFALDYKTAQLVFDRDTMTYIMDNRGVKPQPPMAAKEIVRPPAGSGASTSSDDGILSTIPNGMLLVAIGIVAVQGIILLALFYRARSFRRNHRP
jgi:hypothetical protein